ncbi:MAG: hypothetical protein OXR73_19170 [Myxococcales bacterium]|nr:hypothetical protein [Myxococcales bacterium]
MLIDAIVQQTTTLIAQLSTAAGIRAPLAHVADQVFVDLAREIERQGVGRKVVADMFGLALRTYQRKVQRLTESASFRGRTLWGAIYAFISERESVDRGEVAEHFARDPEEHVAAVLNDLVGSGLVYATGRGIRSVYRIVPHSEQRAHLERTGEDNLVHLAWLTIHRERGILRSQLAQTLSISAKDVARVVARLAEERRITATNDPDPALEAAEFAIPVGDARGWEVAVFDHFSAVSAAIASKVKRGPGSQVDDVVGGATLSFDIHETHPLQEEVLALLPHIRGQVNHVWNRVIEHNRRNPPPSDQLRRVTFYFGQNVEDAGETAQDLQPEGVT